MLNYSWFKKIVPGIVLILCLNETDAAVVDTNANQSALKNVKHKIQLLQQSLAKDKAAETTLEEQLKASELQLNTLNNEMRDLNLQFEAEENKIQQLKTNQEKFLSQLENQRKLLAQQIRLFYHLGNMRSVKTLLNPDNLNNINRQLYYYNTLSSARLKLTNDIKQTLSTLNTNMVEIEEHQTALKNLLSEKQNQHQQELQIQANRQHIIAQYQQKQESKEQQLATLTANQKNLENLLNNLELHNGQIALAPFKQLRGKLDWPIDSKLSEPATAGAGLLLSAPQGSPVHAVYGGKVIFANWLRGYGLLVIINHGNGFMSLYARNQAIYTKVGASVLPRDVIATLGKSGGYQSPGLYFEIRHNGIPIDPKIWFR